ncbi:MAG: hypothetical protein KF861_08255 [Planctomycetaceae bacterium]|nr:hypothetical protein [Planctomycetaceae bacterium]
MTRHAGRRWQTLSSCGMTPWRLIVAVALVFGATTLGLAEGVSETKVLNSTTDGWPIHITYFPAQTKESKSGSPDAGVVILLHGKGGDRRVWEQKHGNAKDSIAGILQQVLGMAVVSVDLRKHGESTQDAAGKTETVLRNEDYQHMWQGDLEAVKQFLLQEHQAQRLNINKLAIVAADEMAPIAARFAVADWTKLPYDDAPANTPNQRTPRGQDVRALVFLSPSNTAGNVNIMGPIRELRSPQAGIAMLALVGQKDLSSSSTVKNIERAVKSSDREGQRTYFPSFPEVKFSGTDLLGKADIQAEVLIGNFLDKHIVKLDSPWRDRRSRLERN